MWDMKAMSAAVYGWRALSAQALAMAAESDRLDAASVDTGDGVARGALRQAAMAYPAMTTAVIHLE
jgi:hypothetical protein